MDGRKLFKTRIHICHHGLVFSNMALSWVSFFVTPGVYSPPDLLQVFAILFLMLFIHSIILFFFFHNSVRWRSKIGLCVTASLLGYPGLFSVFKSILLMLQSWWSLSFLWAPVSSVFFQALGNRSLCSNYNRHHR